MHDLSCVELQMSAYSTTDLLQVGETHDLQQKLCNVRRALGANLHHDHTGETGKDFLIG